MRNRNPNQFSFNFMAPAAADAPAAAPAPIRAQPEPCGHCGANAPVHGVAKLGGDDAVVALCAQCTVKVVQRLIAEGRHVQPCYLWAVAA